MRVLLTGSSGYIGRNLIGALRAEGCEVVGLDRRPPSRPRPDRHLQADILDKGAAEQAMQHVDCVFHLAAAKDDWGISRQGYFRDNTKATRRLLMAGRREGIRRWVFFSSVSAMGPSDSPTDGERALDPIHAYGESKAEAERLFESFASETDDAQVLILRPSVVYGPGNPSNTNVFRLIDAVHNGRFLMVGDGRTVKSTSYIENLVAATVFLYRRMVVGLQTFVYVDRPALTNEEIVDMIYACLGRRRTPVRIPLWLAEPLGRIGDFAGRLADIDVPITSARIRKFCTSTHYGASRIKELGFEQPVDNQTAMKRTVEDYLSQQQTESP